MTKWILLTHLHHLEIEMGKKLMELIQNGLNRDGLVSAGNIYDMIDHTTTHNHTYYPIAYDFEA